MISGQVPTTLGACPPYGAPVILSPRKDHRQERSLRSRRSDAQASLLTDDLPGKTRHLSGGRERCAAVRERLRADTSYGARALAPARWPISTARARGTMKLISAKVMA